jgi:hypothetical protein
VIDKIERQIVSAKGSLKKKGLDRACEHLSPELVDATED